MSPCGRPKKDSHYDERGNHTMQENPLFLRSYSTEPMQDSSIWEGPTIMNVDEILKNVSEKINDNVKPQLGGSCPPSIFRVPTHLRHGDRHGSGKEGDAADKAYKPLLVPIGPYHQEGAGLLSPNFTAIQNFKWQCVRWILCRHSENDRPRLLKNCFWWLSLPGVLSKVKDHYSEEIKLLDEELVPILFADACFIIHLFLKKQGKNVTIEIEEETTTTRVTNPIIETDVGKTEEITIEISKLSGATSGKDKEKGNNVEFEQGPSILDKKETNENDRQTMRIPELTTIPTKDKGKGKMVEFEDEKTNNFVSNVGPYRVEEENTTQEGMIALNIDEDDREINGPLIGGQWTWNIVLYDLLKLENQMPFFVIQRLYKELKISSDIDNLLDLVVNLFSHIHPKKASSFQNTYPRNANFHHLLDLIRSSLVCEMNIKPSEERDKAPDRIPNATEALIKLKPREKRDKAPDRIPNATELRKALIKLGKSMDNSKSFLDVRYNNGVIELPKLQVYDYTETLFLNLIAFEQCFPSISPEKAFITQYAVLMDCIIDSPQDVGLLTSRGILVSRLHNDEAVADLFNNLCKNVKYKIQDSYLENLFLNVNNHYHSKMRKSFATLRRDYCPNTWAFCGVSTGVVLLFLAFVQSLFAVISYFKDHPSTSHLTIDNLGQW